jgi:hypothetical protein
MSKIMRSRRARILAVAGGCAVAALAVTAAPASASTGAVRPAAVGSARTHAPAGIIFATSGPYERYSDCEVDRVTVSQDPNVLSVSSKCMFNVGLYYFAYYYFD